MQPKMIYEIYRHISPVQDTPSLSSLITLPTNRRVVNLNAKLMRFTDETVNRVRGWGDPPKEANYVSDSRTDRDF